MTGGRVGPIPDGAMIIKAMFTPPAARYDSIPDRILDTMISAWAVMVKDSIGSKDGWYWSFYGPGQSVDSAGRYPFDYPNSDFGIYCVRCHASAADDFTFSSLSNVKGFPGDPITFRVDNSWLPKAQPSTGASHASLASDIPKGFVSHTPDPAFLALYNTIPAIDRSQVQNIPPVTYDHVIVGPGSPTQFITSDQCLSCHDGQPPNLGPNMFIPTSGSNGINLSPYGEWNWSMMGLAGRDPIFYAQLESELVLHPTHADSIQNLCFSCHGVMGQRQFTIDHPGKLFTREMTQITDQANPYARYGSLARDGISCTVCHQIVDDKKPLVDIMTGRFEVSRPGQFEKGVSYIYGPFESPSTRAMDSSLGMKPMHNSYIQSSRLCGSCHTVNLPVYDKSGRQTGTFYEQSTYLEWLNSQYQNELGTFNNATVKSCQNCHMPNRYPDNENGTPLAFRIANIQDQTYPETDHRAPLSEITVPIRPAFARHTLLGINQWGLEMFNQFDDILGVRKTDYMTGSSNGLPFAIAESDSLAKTKTATVQILDLKQKGVEVEARVKVTNLTGHRFPSGVGFRRAFLEFKVVDERGSILWSSGRTNTLGVIVDGNGRPLPSEFLEEDPKTGQQRYEPHYQNITRQDQAQIYQELVKNPEGRFTTSFLALADPVKDNRLLPIGWTRKGPTGFQFSHETMPEGNVIDDKQFLDGTGSDIITYTAQLPNAPAGRIRVVATLYYQSIPPFYLRDRFTIAPNGKGTQRLHYLASHLRLPGTNIEGWRLEIAKAER
jgi:hypothetical protein